MSFVETCVLNCLMNLTSEIRRWNKRFGCMRCFEMLSLTIKSDNNGKYCRD